MTERLTPIALLGSIFILAGCAQATELATPTCGDDRDLNLRIDGAPLPTPDDVVAGVDLDGSVTAGGDEGPPDYDDPDGTRGVDAAGNLLGLLVEEFYDQTLDSTLAGNALSIVLSYDTDPTSGACEGLRVAHEGTVRTAVWSGEVYRVTDLGDVPFTVDLGGVATEVVFRDLAVRIPSDETDITLGGWITVDDLYAASIASLSDQEVTDWGPLIGQLYEGSADIVDDDGTALGLSFMLHATSP